MGVDCVVVLRPKNPKKVRKRERRLQFNALEDGTLLLFTSIRLGDVEEEPKVLRRWLNETFGADLKAVHDDDRGVLFYGDATEPASRTYKELVEELEYCGRRWLSLDASPDGVANASRANALTKSKSFAKAKRRRSPLGRELSAKQFEELEAESKRIGRMRKRGQLVEGDGSDTVCILVQRASPVRPVPDKMRALIDLPDTSTIIVTAGLSSVRVALNSAHDALEWELADEYEECISQHTDPRGVPIFRAEHLKALQNVNSYEEALDTLEGVVAFLVPKGTAAREAERVSALRQRAAAANKPLPTIKKMPSRKNADTRKR